MAYVTVQGHVTRTHPKYISVEERMMITSADGRSFELSRYWQCWVSTKAPIPEGTTLTVKGTLSTKIAKDYNTGDDRLNKKGERMVEHILNDCTISDVKAPSHVHSSEWGEPDPATVVVSSQEAPF